VVPAGQPAPNNASFLTPFHGFLFFTSTGGLWKTDGTAANTVLVSPVQPDGTGGSERQFVPYADRFLFFGKDTAGVRAIHGVSRLGCGEHDRDGTRCAGGNRAGRHYSDGTAERCAEPQGKLHA
jgi:ELWxxDGT repeat protein